MSVESSDTEAPGDDFGFVLNESSQSKLKPQHPCPETIRDLWQIYIENVDPLTKLVHVPTLRPAIDKAVNNTNTIPRGVEALMFAIYAAAIMTLNDDDCMQMFQMSRRILLLKYVSATKMALSRARFMETTSLIVLQALVLHLLSVRDVYEPRAIWTLTGVAIRIAQGMGLDREGMLPALPPFETEVRRRVWWLLKTHDFRTAELCGLPKFRDLDTSPESTKWPTNVNDDQLYPGMSALPQVSHAMTDAVFICFRYELTKFAAGRIAKMREKGLSPNQWDLRASSLDRKEVSETFREIEDLLETKYIRFCDPSQPLQLLTMLIARSAMNNIRFLTYHPRRWPSIEEAPEYERLLVWDISLKLLEQHRMVQSSAELKHFAWHAAYFIQWHAFIHVLDTLRAKPLLPEAGKVWTLVGDIYRHDQSMIHDMRKPIHVAVGSLCLKSYSARETAIPGERLRTPDFIQKLRQQHRALKDKLKLREQSPRVVPSEDTQKHSEDTQPNQQHSFIVSEEMPENMEQYQRGDNLPLNSPQAGTGNENDLFWHTNGYEDHTAIDWDNVMNIDTSLMFNEDNTTGGPGWDQWDAWLAESNARR